MTRPGDTRFTDERLGPIGTHFCGGCENEVYLPVIKLNVATDNPSFE